MTDLIIQSLLLIAAVFFYIPTQLWFMAKLKWSKEDRYGYSFGFWGKESWVRKWKRTFDTCRGMQADIGKPAFWQADGILVFLTDGYHLFQFLSWRCIYGAIAIGTPYPWWVFGALFVGHPFFFWLFQKFLTK